MNRTIRFALVSAVAVSAFAVLPGCQNRNEADGTGAALPASATMDRAMVATKDTEWLSSPNPANAEKGTLTKNTRVFFENTAATGEWQAARLDGKVVYVKSADFAPYTANK
jgi:hypothetical protein